MKVDVYNKSGNKTSNKVDLKNSVFKVDPNEHSVYLAVNSEMAALRQGSHQSKNRSKVSGGGAKPYRQKGTGRARVGSTRNPSRVHGGTAFGPNVHSYSKKVNKKVKQLARKSVLSSKVSSGSLLVIDDLKVDSSKTKNFISIVDSFDLLDQKVTFLTHSLEDNLYYSSRNVKNVSVIPVSTASTFDLLDNKMIIIDRDSVDFLNNQLAD
tara:strand:+ start:164 stop:793 length:630 start_codon:yes stop_codon:yes gene_type:complete